MTIERLDTTDPAWVDDPRLADYRAVRDPELVRRGARFLAEGRLVVATLLQDSPLVARSVLADETAWAALERTVEPTRLAAVEAYVVPGGSLRDLAGWKFHQGCLAVGERPPPCPARELLAAAPGARLWVGLDAVTNPDNVGAIFRSAAALGAAGVLLEPSCASPLYRKAVRTSMGAALRLPFSHGPAWHESLAALRDARVHLLALTPDADAQDLESACADLPPGAPVALLLGAEGTGLGATSLERADARVGIPMRGGVDSLNVAAAAAIALYRLGLR